MKNTKNLYLMKRLKTCFWMKKLLIGQKLKEILSKHIFVTFVYDSKEKECHWFTNVPENNENFTGRKKPLIAACRVISKTRKPLTAAHRAE